MAYTPKIYVKALMWYNECDKTKAEQEFILYKELGGINIFALNDIVCEYKRKN